MKKLQIAKHRCLTTIFNQHSRSLQSAQFQGGHHSVTNSVSDPNVQYGHVCVCVWILKLRTKTFFLGHSDLWPSSTPSGHLCHIWRHALKVFLRYRGQENGKKRTNPRTQWSQLLLVLRNKYLKQDNVAGSEMIYKNNICRYTHSCPHSCHVPQHKHIPVTCVFAFQRFRSSSSILLSACREPFFSDSTDKDWCSGLMSDWSFVTWQSKIQTV